MSDLAEFLLARIAEDEAMNERGPEPEAWCDRAEGAHFSYARLRAECDAKRRIVEERCAQWKDIGYGPLVHAVEYQNRDAVLRYLALPYADRPDYRDEWKP